MPFAVSCRSCGARFSVADELYRKRFAGRIVTVRCKRCQASIRLDASEPPGKPEKKVDQRPKWVPKPAPPPPRPAHRSRALEAAASVPSAPGSVDNAPVPRDAPDDLFQTPPPSDAPPRESRDADRDAPEDITEYARSEPPPSDAPAPFELARNRRAAARGSAEDVDFLLGLSGNSRTAAALVSPALPTFDDTPQELEPPTPRNAPLALLPPVVEQSAGGENGMYEAAESLGSVPAPSPPVFSLGGESNATSAKRRWPRVLLLLGLASLGVIAALFARGFQLDESRITSRRPTRPLEAEATRSEASAANSRTPPAPAFSPSATTPAASSPTRAAYVPRSQPRSGDHPPAGTEKTEPEKVATVPKPPRAAAPVVSAPARSEPAPSSPSSSHDTSESMATEPFDRVAAAAALAKAAAEASACKQEGDPSGTTSATVTFAPSGRVTTATLSGPPFAGTKTGSCIAASLRRARVPAFSGEKVTVGKSVVIR